MVVGSFRTTVQQAALMLLYVMSELPTPLVPHVSPLRGWCFRDGAGGCLYQRIAQQRHGVPAEWGFRGIDVPTRAVSGP